MEHVKWTIKIGDLPIQIRIFHSKLLVYQGTRPFSDTKPVPLGTFTDPGIDWTELIGSVPGNAVGRFSGG